jgi:hypothetical protein
MSTHSACLLYGAHRSGHTARARSYLINMPTEEWVVETWMFRMLDALETHLAAHFCLPGQGYRPAQCARQTGHDDIDAARCGRNAR